MRQTQQINDFSRASDKLFSILYADDTSVFIEGYEYDKLIETMNNEMKKVDIWLQANGLVINLEKTHFMAFHRARINPGTPGYRNTYKTTFLVTYL